MKYVKILTVIAALILAASCGQSQKNNSGQSQQSETETIGGKYSFGDDVEKGPVGSVMVYPLENNEALFYIDVCLGAPSYNSGTLFGRMIIENNTGIYDSNIDNEFLSCVLRFEFSSGQVKISTDENDNDCGFGHGVFADNIYKLTDKSIPEYYINMTDDTIMFKDLK